MLAGNHRFRSNNQDRQFESILLRQSVHRSAVGFLSARKSSAYRECRHHIYSPPLGYDAWRATHCATLRRTCEIGY
jgi:hypothetical protein